MRVILLFLILASVNLSSIGQEYEEVYFDKNWKLCSEKEHHYYRYLIRQDSIFVVNDFYKNHRPQYTGKFVVYQGLEELLLTQGYLPDHGATGRATYFDSKGRKENSIDFLANGGVVDTTEEYNTLHYSYWKNGNISLTWYELNNSVDHGLTKFYNQKGELYGTQEYTQGKETGKYTRFYFDDTIYEETMYNDGKRDGWSISYYDYPSEIKEKRLYKEGKLVSKVKFKRKKYLNDKN